jgi:hypothetical protein
MYVSSICHIRIKSMLTNEKENQVIPVTHIFVLIYLKEILKLRDDRLNKLILKILIEEDIRIFRYLTYFLIRIADG